LVVQTKEMKTKLDQGKREANQLRSLENQLRWDLDREEKKQTQEEIREEARQIMEWREAQATELKEYVAGKTKEQRIQELLASKEYQEFKREWKQAIRQQDLQRIKEALANDMEFARWQAELKESIDAERLTLQIDRYEEVQELREIRRSELERQKVETQENRALDEHLEVSHKVNQVSAEKEDLLRTLQYMRSVRQKSPCPAAKVGRTSPARSPIRASSRTSPPRMRGER